jgi:hypothetical protein
MEGCNIMATMINAGGAGEIAVDIERLPAVALQHVIAIGLRNVLMDSHASVTREQYGDNVGDAKRSVAMKKLESLYAGDIRANATRTRTVDPIRRRAVQMAMETVAERWRRAKDTRQKDIKAVRAEAAKLVSANPAYMHLAEKHIAEMRELGIEPDEMDDDESNT